MLYYDGLGLIIIQVHGDVTFVTVLVNASGAVPLSQHKWEDALP